MNFTRPALAAVMLATTALPASAQEMPAGDAMRFVNRLLGHYALLTARSFVDLTYDTLAVEPGTNDMVITGLKLYPVLDWDENGECEITIDRAVAADITSFETLQSLIEVSGLHVPIACLDPMQGGMVASFGYPDGLTAERMSIETSYDLPTSAADVVIQASFAGVGDVALTANFDYLWFRFPTDGGDPEPAALLGAAELAIENGGIWEKLEPMIGAQMGDLNAVPQMAGMMIAQSLGDPASGGQPGPEVVAFSENVTAELTRFLADKDRIVVTAAPERGVWLGPDSFGSPADAIAQLQPVVSAVPMAQRAMIGPEELTAALSGGAGLDDDGRLRVGRALLTGIGAPRVPAEGAALLEPLAEGWNAEAAGLLADAALDAGEDQRAYAMALRAMAGGEAGAAAIADELETRLPLADVLVEQDTQGNAWPGASDLVAESNAAIAAGDLNAIRKLAYRAAAGQGMPRNVKAAYFWASLAAAGGDRGAGGLRDRMDARYGARDAAVWRPAAAEAAAQALEAWTTGGLGGRIAERVK